MNNILILSIKGIGDTLHFIPALKRIISRYPEAKITYVVGSNACREMLAGFTNVIDIPTIDLQSSKNWFDVYNLMKNLRRRKFEVSITTFPSNRIWYNLFAFGVGSAQRITHSYDYGSLRTLAWLQNIRVPAQAKLHSVDQNIRLLEPIGIPVESVVAEELSPPLLPEDEIAAKGYLDSSKVRSNDILVGVHPSIIPGAPCKNWDLNTICQFAVLIDWLVEHSGVKVMLFAGKDEISAVSKICAELKGSQPLRPQLPIRTIAVLLQRLRLFINTDSGLGHLAAAMGTPTITVFGPANPIIARPYGPMAIVIENQIECSPCYYYPFSRTVPDVRCKKGPCTNKIPLDRIMNEIDKSLINIRERDT